MPLYPKPHMSQQLEGLRPTLELCTCHHAHDEGIALRYPCMHYVM